MHAIYLQAEISGPESRGTIGVWCARNRPEKLESKVYEEKLAMYSGFIMNACILPSPSTLTLTFTYPSLHCLIHHQSCVSKIFPPFNIFLDVPRR